MFSTDESIYYSRQILLQDFGQDAQNKLKNSHVFVVGAGGLGCPALLYLAGAGVGTITIADNDKVQVNNLHRQVLFSMDDVGKNKAEAACEHLRKLNPFITLHSIPHRITTENIHQFITGADVIIDASDNFETRFILGDYTAQERIPLVFAAI
ncbi:MAG TPA: HesA/MoeB/ThiF family protein, partial [Bacteroidales bacterium]